MFGVFQRLEFGRSRQSGKKMADKVRFQPEGICVHHLWSAMLRHPLVEENQKQHTRHKGLHLGELERQNAFCKCKRKRLQRICRMDFSKRWLRGLHASSRPASMHSVRSKTMKQMRSTDISCSECLVDLSVFSYFWSFNFSFSQIDKPTWKGSSIMKTYCENFIMSIDVIQ